MLSMHSEYHGKQAGSQTISVNVDLVNVLFTVFDRKRKFITNYQVRARTGHYALRPDAFGK